MWQRMNEWAEGWSWRWLKAPLGCLGLAGVVFWVVVLCLALNWLAWGP